jgi:formylglycine-generating enzyme
MQRIHANLLILTISVFMTTCSSTARAVGIDFETVGDAGNAADSTGYGAVSYSFDIGKYEITAGQYCEFLNAVAPTDNYALYTNMDASSYYLSCNIIRTGASGSYHYSVASNWANRPVSCVNWSDVARFCNWLQNGQKTYAQDPLTTENGSYTLNGIMNAATLLNITRNPDAHFFIPTENEWYKAAYYDPNKGGNNVAGYWLYPTKSDTAPSNIVSSAGTNNANFFANGNWSLDAPYYRTEVGAFADSASAYGTFDQGGNVQELNDGVIGSSRGVRGGSIDYTVVKLQSTYQENAAPNYNSANVGFRIVYVPEPSTIISLLIGVVGGVMIFNLSRIFTTQG